MNDGTNLIFDFTLLDVTESSSTMPTTEFAVFPTRPDYDPMALETEGYRVLMDTLTTMYEQEGCQHMYHGVATDDPGLIHACVVWDDIESHRQFQQSPHYGDFVRKFLPWIVGPGEVFHVDLEPEEGSMIAMTVPLTEIITCYTGQTSQDGLREGFTKVLESLGKEEAPGYVASAAGVTYETIDNEGIQGKAVVFVIGWESEEQCVAHRQIRSFEDQIRTALPSIDKVNIVQVQLKKLGR